MKDMLTKMWEKFKGTIAMAGITAILGLSIVTTSLGLEAFDGPDGSLCIREAPQVPEATNAE